MVIRSGQKLTSKIGDDEGYSIYQTTDGGYIIAGKTNSFGTYDVFFNQNRYIW
ncbi:MAG: hypothetical protein IPK08_20060 [Bacteroidetes bacterium]|nr:hypothetical protein [Bacteroidota bacterium]